LHYTGKSSERNIKHRIEFDEIDYGIDCAPFCTPAMLPSLSADDHKRLMDTAAMRERFRCFFLHLAVELGVHPVALQVIAPHIIATCIPTFSHTHCPSLLFPTARVPRAMRSAVAIDR
jgi:hypothetical protein